MDYEEGQDAPEKAASELNEIELCARLKGWYRQDHDHWAAWRREAKALFGFFAGDQWDAADKAHLEQQGRPVITFNRSLAIIKAISGIEINGRHETVFLPRGTLPGQVKANELLSAASQWMGDNCDAEDAQSSAFQDTLICGMGWTEGRISTDVDPDGAYVEEKIDPLEMLVDKAARSKNVADARRLFRTRKMALSEAKAMFAETGKIYDDADFDAAWADGADTSEAVPVEERRKKLSEGSAPSSDEEVTIVHAQWWEKEDFYRLQDPQTGQISQLSKQEYAKIEARMKDLGGPPLMAVKQSRRVYRQAWIGGKILKLADGASPKGFSWCCITGELDRNKGVFYGVGRLMRDPQMWANKWLSQTLHILNTTAKGGILAEADAFKDQRAAQDTYAQPDAITWAAKGAISGGKIMQKPGVGIPNNYVNLLEFAISSIRDVTGVNLELLGMRDANQAGILEAQRKQAAMTILATLFDSLRRFRKLNGRLRLHYIQEYLSDGRLIRITGDQGDMQTVPLVREQTLGDYEVIVDDAPTSPNAKEQTWATIQQVLPAFRELLTPEAVIAILEYSPLPSKLVDAFKDMAEKAAQPSPEKQAEKELMIEGAVAQIAKDTASAEATRAKGILDLTKAGAAVFEQQMASAMGNMMSPEPWKVGQIDGQFAVAPMDGGGPVPPVMPQTPTVPQGPQQLPMPPMAGE